MCFAAKLSPSIHAVRDAALEGRCGIVDSCSVLDGRQLSTLQWALSNTTGRRIELLLELLVIPNFTTASTRVAGLVVLL